MITGAALHPDAAELTTAGPVTYRMHPARLGLLGASLAAVPAVAITTDTAAPTTRVVLLGLSLLLSFAIVGGREHVVDHSLAELEATLDLRRFVRIHRAAIVNVAPEPSLIGPFTVTVAVGAASCTVTLKPPSAVSPRVSVNLTQTSTSP
jgi:hypothetical protein